MEYFVADSYKDAERVGEPFRNDSGNLVTRIKYICPRCNGKGIIAARVENGRIVPIPVANGVCFQCGGDRFISKVVRLYTEKQYLSAKKAQEKAKEKRAEDAKAKMEQEYETNKTKWLAAAGFNSLGETYVFFGESFSIKDELKAAGFKFDYLLKWHIAEIPEGYEDKVIKFDVNELYTFSAWGKGVINADAAKIVEQRINAAMGETDRYWFGEIGDKITELPVTLVSKNGYESKYGYTNIYTFEDENKHLFSWFTTTNQIFSVGNKALLSGTIKQHDDYRGVKRTILTRCKLKGVD